MVISSPFQAKILQLVWGWEVVIKIPVADHIFHQILLSYSWTTFKIKHLRILSCLCSDSDLLGGDGVFIPSLEKHGVFLLH